MQFASSSRRIELKEIYWRKPFVRDHGIVPQWDLSLAARALNWEWKVTDYQSADIYHLSSTAIRKHIEESLQYVFPRVFQHAAEDQFLRIIDKWTNMVKLPPPVFGYCQERNGICKIDGFHRLAVCFFLEVETIPCWIVGKKAQNILTS